MEHKLYVCVKFVHVVHIIKKKKKPFKLWTHSSYFYYSLEEAILIVGFNRNVIKA